MKIGIFGGSFNPPHMGHINSMQTVLKKTGLDKILVIPNAQNPLKLQIEGASAEHRLEMTKLALANWNGPFEVDDREIKRGGNSYTYETLTELKKENPNDQFFLILGMDQFEELSQWKNPSKILEMAHLIICSRPGYETPTSKEELAGFIQEQVADFDFNFIELKNSNSIQFVRLNDMEISSTELRKWIRSSKNIEKFLPLQVEKYIKENKLYKASGEKIANFKEFTKFCADILFSKKGISVVGWDLTKMSAISEYAVVTSGTSTRHTVSLAENLVDAVKEQYGLYPESIEGVDEGRWVVVDYGSLIIHLFYDFVRKEYSIENLWKQGIDLNLKDPYLEKK